MKPLNSTLIGAAMAAALTAAFAMPAMAEPSAPQVSVTYADLDLTTSAGKAELEARVMKAARAVCTPASQTGTRIERPDRDCMTAAKAQIATAVEARRQRNLAAAEPTRTPGN